MSTTIFCTFEQHDLADLAVGELRKSVAGIKSIHYVEGFNSESNIFNRGTVNNSWAGLFPIETGVNGVIMPSRPVNIKIVCSDTAAKAVEARLVNLRAYQIVRVR